MHKAQHEVSDFVAQKIEQGPHPVWQWKTIGLGPSPASLQLTSLVQLMAMINSTKSNASHLAMSPTFRSQKSIDKVLTETVWRNSCQS